MFMQYTDFSKNVEIESFSVEIVLYHSYYCSKHILCAHVRTNSQPDHLLNLYFLFSSLYICVDRFAFESVKPGLDKFQVHRLINSLHCRNIYITGTMSRVM